ncbi:hypothetical protein [Glaciimonas soli]|uniref:Uncharacterized protein n=1 Tax=Glaciimonas soli TaxID=2590999 RepID=A0A843YYP3_9BURK|nr:hypothetical protein [Glaciimonas soli]MQR02794.1 hypothetical protein [Glaciimonas soli]
MTSKMITKTVSTVDELATAVKAAVLKIVVQGQIEGAPSLRLAPGQSIEGEDDQAALSFAVGQDGLQLTTDNVVRNLHVETSADQRAIFNDTSVDSLGTIHLYDVVTVGQVQLLARDKVRGGHVEVDGLHVIAADARAHSDRPAGFGVRVIQGAFTLWNMQADNQVVISANLVGLSAGHPAAPVLGSGIFVSGPGFDKGKLSVQLLETGAVYSDGRIAPGTPDVITGGVFTVHGAYVGTVRNLGPVVTYGVNDMALDNWGQVDIWEAEDKITSYGPSGIGFVNFGIVNELRVKAPIETFGQGARGFNVYAGTVNLAEFDRITTHANGAVGVQISQPIGQLRVLRGIETFGATGESLVKGVVMTLSAIGLSIKPGGSAREITIDGGVITHGEGIAPLEVHGEIGALHITGATRAAQA